MSLFFDLSKAFETVNYTILLKKLDIYGNNHNWIKSYLSNRKQYIEIYPRSKSSLKYVKCGVSQESILASFLFLLNVNDLKNAWLSLLYTIIFVDNTHLFSTHRNIRSLLSDMNKELPNINEWFLGFFLWMLKNQLLYFP